MSTISPAGLPRQYSSYRHSGIESRVLRAFYFGAHSLGNREMRRQQREHAAVAQDTAEYVAERILPAVRNEVPEQYIAD